MIDDRILSIIYQSQIYYNTLVNSLVESKKLGKALDQKWEKADLILGYLTALNYRSRLTANTDIDGVNFILYCLIKLCELNIYPVTPTFTFQAAPVVIVGQQGPQGIQGNQGITGATGLATDISTGPFAVTTVADQFTLASAKGARWDYVIRENGGAQRAGEIIGNWNATGSAIDYFDNSTSDIGGSTVGVEFSVALSAGNIQLIATVTTGSWTLFGTRYFIPNNGNGTGPLSAVLANGNVLIGNVSNVATAVLLSGAITTTNAGVTSISAGYITNAMINAAAAIAATKIAAMTVSRAVVTDTSGFITTSAATAAETAFLSGVTSNIQTQLNSKLSAATGAISPYVSANFATANRVAISDGATKLGISSVTTTELGYVGGVTSSIQTQINTLTGTFSVFVDNSVAWLPYSSLSASFGSWANGGNFGFKKTARNTVKLRGLVSSVATENTAATAFTLPAGYRPAVSQRFLVANIAGVNAAIFLDIAPSGNVVPGMIGVSYGNPFPGSSGFYVDGVEFEV